MLPLVHIVRHDSAGLLGCGRGTPIVNLSDSAQFER
jgi:hypothetical protein